MNVRTLSFHGFLAQPPFFIETHLFHLELLRALVEELLVHLHEQLQRVVYQAVDCLERTITMLIYLLSKNALLQQ